MNTGNIAGELQKELDRLAFIMKRKYDRMNPEQQHQVLENIKSMFQHK